MFDNVMIILESVAVREDLQMVRVRLLKSWIQIHDLPMGFMSKTVGK